MKKPLICISCSTSENLSAKTIRKRNGYCKKCILSAKLIEKQKEAHNKPDTLIKHSISSKKNWADKNVRDKMVGGNRYKSGIYHRINGEKVFLKSSYEFMFVEFLESNGIEWRYEDTAFPILSLSSSQYIPDFYLKEYKCYFEVKGYFREHSKIKYKFFLDQYKDINICLTSKEDLDRILTKEVSIENFIKEKNRIFSCL